MRKFSTLIGAMLLAMSANAQTTTNVDCNNVPLWNSGASYPVGFEIKYNDITYKPNITWGTLPSGTEPSPTSTQWTQTGACSASTAGNFDKIFDCNTIQQFELGNSAGYQGNTNVAYNDIVYNTGSYWKSASTAPTATTWIRVGMCNTNLQALNTDAWKLNGNNATTSSFLGTTNTSPLILKSNNLSLLEVNPLGYVQIGNTAQGNWHGSYFTLDVQGRTAITLPQNTTNQNNVLQLYSSDATARLAPQGYRHYLGFSHAKFPDNNQYSFLNVTAYNQVTGQAVPRHLLIQNVNGGNLGIGDFSLTAPTEKLSVNGNTSISGDLSVGNVLKINSITPIGDDLTLNGNLTVLGTKGIVAKRVRVTVDGKFPDYVFTPSYKLRSLDSLESSIKTNGHLPNFDAATKVEAEGMDVSQILQKTVEALEENTLYILELNKRIKALEAQNAILQDQLSSQK